MKSLNYKGNILFGATWCGMKKENDVHTFVMKVGFKDYLLMESISVLVNKI